MKYVLIFIAILCVMNACGRISNLEQQVNILKQHQVK